MSLVIVKDEYCQVFGVPLRVGLFRAALCSGAGHSLPEGRLPSNPSRGLPFWNCHPASQFRASLTAGG